MSKQIEWRCPHCNQKQVKPESGGYPMPGQCTKRPKVNGKYQPHEWTRFRELP